MAKIFISHSSKDKSFVRTLASDLVKLSHEAWLDEWQIKVGDCIVSSIERGITEADYVVIVLSKNSVESGWVEREWKVKYWHEINRNTTMVLPVLIEDCQIPLLLSTKRYADFRTNYAVGLVELMGAISPVINNQSLPEPIVSLKTQSSDVTELIAKVQSKSVLLSQCIAEALALAVKINSSSLADFCRSELTGWDDKDMQQNQPSYRSVQAFFTIDAPINMQYFGWDKNVNRIFDYMRANPDKYNAVNMFMPHSVSYLEEQEQVDSRKTLISITTTTRQFVSDFEYGDWPVHMYFKGDTYTNVLNGIRTELTRHLINLLPRVQIP